MKPARGPQPMVLLSKIVVEISVVQFQVETERLYTNWLKRMHMFFVVALFAGRSQQCQLLR